MEIDNLHFYGLSCYCLKIIFKFWNLSNKIQGEYESAVEYYNKAAENMETDDSERLELSKIK